MKNPLPSRREKKKIDTPIVRKKRMPGIGKRHYITEERGNNDLARARAGFGGRAKKTNGGACYAPTGIQKKGKRAAEERGKEERKTMYGSTKLTLYRGLFKLYCPTSARRFKPEIVEEQVKRKTYLKNETDRGKREENS